MLSMQPSKMGLLSTKYGSQADHAHQVGYSYKWSFVKEMYILAQNSFDKIMIFLQNWIHLIMAFL